MAEDYQIVSPPSQIFKQAGFQTEPAKQVVVEMATYIFDHMDFPESGGMLAYFKDCPFPAKGFPFPHFIHALNGAKRFFKVSIDALTAKEMLVLWMGFLLSRKKSVIMERWLSAYTEAATFVLQPYFLDAKRYSECPLEIRIFLINFLPEIGISHETADKFAEVFSLMIQGDDAYRLRIEDLMSETTKEKMLKNPAKEIKRLIDILMEREPNAVRDSGNVGKFNKIARMLNYLFLIPRFKKAFKGAIEKSHFEKFQLDDADRYHMMLREDYKAMGWDIKDRVEMYKAFHSVFPPFPPRTIIKLKQ